MEKNMKNGTCFEVKAKVKKPVSSKGDGYVK
jgi:hypothetical protein